MRHGIGEQWGAEQCQRHAVQQSAAEAVGDCGAVVAKIADYLQITGSGRVGVDKDAVDIQIHGAIVGVSSREFRPLDQGAVTQIVGGDQSASGAVVWAR